MCPTCCGAVVSSSHGSTIASSETAWDGDLPVGMRVGILYDGVNRLLLVVRSPLGGYSPMVVGSIDLNHQFAGRRPYVALNLYGVTARAKIV